MKRLVVEFTKMHGAGNDFIVIDNRFYHFSPEEQQEIARRWCSRTEGIGADGLLAYEAPDDEEHHYRMRYTNADGSRATMCANGARCLARYARDSGIGAEIMAFESDDGLYRVSVTDNEQVRLFLPPPKKYQEQVALSEATVCGPYAFIWTGTEHVVCFVDDVAAAPVAEEGSAVRGDTALAPNGTNVNFAEVRGDALHVRTYEKGVEAETRACGTGAVAAALVARFTGRVSAAEIPVHMAGGTLLVGAAIEVDNEAHEVYLEGPAVKVFRGTIEY